MNEVCKVFVRFLSEQEVYYRSFSSREGRGRGKGCDKGLVKVDGVQGFFHLCSTMFKSKSMHH